MRGPGFVMWTGVLASAIIHSGARILHAPNAAAPVAAAAESSVVVPAGSLVMARVQQNVWAPSLREGSTLYLRTTFPVVVGAQLAIPARTLMEARIDSIRTVESPRPHIELTLRLSRMIYFGRGTLDLVAPAGPPNENPARRPVMATLALEPDGADSLVHLGSSAQLVLTTAAVIDPRLAVMSTASRTRPECHVAGTAYTPAIFIPGTPPTPAAGEFPYVPGTPDVMLPGTPALSGSWEKCF